MTVSLKKVKELLIKNRLDAILISSISNIVYLTNYSGFSKDEREAYLLVGKNFQYVLTDGRYAEAVKKLILDFMLVEISSKLPFEKALKKLVKKHKIKKVGFEGYNISFLEYKKLSRCFDDSNHRSFESLRSIKTPDEIFKIEKACKLGDKTFAYILKKIKLGISEKELANEIEFFIKKNGADISFRPIVAFGKNSAVPHHQAANSKLTNNEIILFDFGIKLNNYCSDMTRTVFFGKANAEFKKMYNTVFKAQSRAIDFLNSLSSFLGSDPQNPKGSDPQARSIDKVARDYIISKGYKTIPHSLGHGIGIEVHEAPHLSPKSKDILKEGMVFSIEPGIYLPDFGGVRIEDLVVLEKNKLRLLTHSPKTLTEL